MSCLQNFNQIWVLCSEIYGAGLIKADYKQSMYPAYKVIHHIVSVSPDVRVSEDSILQSCNCLRHTSEKHQVQILYTLLNKSTLIGIFRTILCVCSTQIY